MLLSWAEVLQPALANGSGTWAWIGRHISALTWPKPAGVKSSIPNDSTGFKVLMSRVTNCWHFGLQRRRRMAISDLQILKNQPSQTIYFIWRTIGVETYNFDP